jgi:hypothetical protein
MSKQPPEPVWDQVRLTTVAKHCAFTVTFIPYGYMVQEDRDDTPIIFTNAFDAATYMLRVARDCVGRWLP